MEWLHDFYRDALGYKIIRFRDKLHIRRDPFLQFLPSEDSPADNQILRKTSLAVENLSSICFDECVTVTYKSFTVEEASCIRRCVQEYFDGYLKLSRSAASSVGIL